MAAKQNIDFSDAPITLFKGIQRQESFIKSLTELYNIVNPVIVEVGVSREIGSISDGDSTAIWSWYINKYGGSYHGCDINSKNVEMCSLILKTYIKSDGKAENVTVTESDGLQFLKNFNDSIDLLYLDGLDWDLEHKSSLTHIEWLLTILPKIKIDGLILIDDIFDVNNYRGKGEIVIPYLLGIGDYTCIHKGYQFLFKRTK